MYKTGYTHANFNILTQYPFEGITKTTQDQSILWLKSQADIYYLN
jgi:hypothetical protein